MTHVEAVMVWFRQDLRLGDNPALRAAVATGLPVVPVYIWHPPEAGEWAMGAASRVWLHGSLNALKRDLQFRGSDLILRQGSSAEALIRLAKEIGARKIHCNARYEPWAIAQQEQAQRALAQQDITLVIHTGGTLLWEPDAVATQQGKPYQMFTPYFNRCIAQLPETTPWPAPVRLAALNPWPDSLAVKALSLLPATAWDAGIRSFLQPGEKAGHQQIQAFLAHTLANYAHTRNLPAIQGTSFFSPYLAHGELSPRQIWQVVEMIASGPGHPVALQKSAPGFLREIVWREFAYHVLYHFPHTTGEPLKAKFAAMPWRSNPDWLARWRKGEAGYPLVDAGMRQLWRTGWMHNRVRMLVGSFLTKDLLIPWQDGARWFWDTLVDADLANNSLNWQWVAGCGADAQPFFRIFNPTAQSEKFDPNGDYIRQWVPELSRLPKKAVHAPARLSAGALQLAGLMLGQTYPAPIVAHEEARLKALHLYQTLSR